MALEGEQLLPALLAQVEATLTECARAKGLTLRPRGDDEGTNDSGTSDHAFQRQVASVTWSNGGFDRFRESRWEPPPPPPLPPPLPPPPPSLPSPQSAKGGDGMGKGRKGTASGSDAKGRGGGKRGGGSEGGRGVSVSSSRSDTAGSWRREG